MYAVGGIASLGSNAKIWHLPLSSPTPRRRISILVIHSGHFSKGFPAGTEKTNNNQKERAYACGRSRARITCGTQKSGKTTEDLNAQRSDSCNRCASYSNRSRVFPWEESARTIAHEGMIPHFEKIFSVRDRKRVEVSPNRSRLICRDDNGMRVKLELRIDI
ncbi:hypothetical protein ACS0PU_001514 [Formica fusca]